MTLWIDGDSCPSPALKIALKTQGRHQLGVIVVADRPLKEMAESAALFHRVQQGMEAVDQWIIAHAEPGDITLTRDLQLGIELLKKGVVVINDRGKIWQKEELQARIHDSMLMQALRQGGLQQKKYRRYDRQDAHQFAASLDRLITHPPKA